MRTSPLTRTLVTVFTLALCPASGIAFDVTGCDQTVPRNEVGLLRGDLTCPQGTPGVRLERNAVLQLDGHSITTDGTAAIRCLERRCTVTGPGTVDSTGTGILALVKRMALSDLSVSGRPALLSDPTLKVKMRRVDLTNVDLLGTSILGGTVRVSNVTATSNGAEGPNYGLLAKKVTGDGLTVSGFEYGLLVATVKASSVAVLDNFVCGIAASRIAKISGAIVSGNGAGVYAERRIVLTDVEATGNFNADLGRDLDVVSKRAPRLLGSTTCGVSALCNPTSTPFCVDGGGTWNVCAND